MIASIEVVSNSKRLKIFTVLYSQAGADLFTVQYRTASPQSTVGGSVPV